MSCRWRKPPDHSTSQHSPEGDTWLPIPTKAAVSEFVGKLKVTTSRHINEAREARFEFH